MRAFNLGHQNRNLRQVKWGFDGQFALQQFKATHDRNGSCVTSIAVSTGDAQLYER
jgi:hypothetical protein